MNHEEALRAVLGKKDFDFLTDEKKETLLKLMAEGSENWVQIREIFIKEGGLGK